MRSSLVHLLKIQFIEQTNINSLVHEKNGKERAKSIMVSVAWVIIAIALMAYSFGMAYGYGRIGLANMVPAYALALTAMLNITFTFIKTNGVLFATKDYDMLIALPIKTQTIISSKFLYMYLWNLLISLGIMIPMGISYGCYAKVEITGYVFWFLISLVSPLLPMTLASAAGALIIAIGSRFRRFKVLAQVILTVLLIVGIFGGSALLGSVEETANMEVTFEEAGIFLKGILNKIYPMTFLFEDAINNASFIHMILFLAISLGVYYIFVTIVSMKYQQINTALVTSVKKSDYKLNELKANSVIKAIVFNELKRFTSSMVYITNMGIGLLMALIFAVAIIVAGKEVIISEMDMSEDMLLYIAPFMIGMVLSMTATPAVSLSLEGKSFWIIQSLPLDMKAVYKGKIIFNLVLLIPAACICSLILIIGLRPDIVTALLYFAVTVAMSILTSTYSMLIGKHFVKFNWKNEIEVIKQGAASLFGILGNMLIGIAFMVIMVILSSKLVPSLAMLLVSILMLAITLVIYKLVMRPKKFS